MKASRLVTMAAVIAAALVCGGAVVAQEHGVGQPAAAPAAATHAAAEHAEGPNPMAFGPDLAIFSAIVFLLLLGFLSWFAWPQIAAALDERERAIADNILAAAHKHEEAKQLLAEHEAKLATAAAEVRGILDEARRDAEHTKANIVAEAREAAEGEKQRAVREIQRAKEGAIHDLAVATADAVIDLAEQVTAKQLTAERNNQLVRDAMAKLAATQPSKN